MNCFAMIAILIATPLVPAQAAELTCRASLAELAVAAQAAEIAAEAADRSLAEVDGLAAKLDSCRKERSGKNGCAKLADQLKEAEAALDLVEEELSIALEQVDAAYDDFDIACSWEEGEANVLVRASRARARALRSPARHAVLTDARSASKPGR